MIKAKTNIRGSFAVRLAYRARLLAAAGAESRVRSHQKEGSRWRNARLLWPLFSRDN
ncbi:hypothetical protein [Aurantiacibacter marinus]|nr:hypothetical protein [Aurantiacibacter marinus]